MYKRDEKNPRGASAQREEFIIGQPRVNKGFQYYGKQHGRSMAERKGRAHPNVPSVLCRGATRGDLSDDIANDVLAQLLIKRYYVLRPHFNNVRGAA